MNKRDAKIGLRVVAPDVMSENLGKAFEGAVGVITRVGSSAGDDEVHVYWPKLRLSTWQRVGGLERSEDES